MRAQTSLLAGCGLLAAIVAVPVSAADIRPGIPLKPVAAVPVFDWTGFYAGVQAGVGQGTTQHFDAGSPLEPFKMNGWAGGGTVGLNWQVAGPLVLGIEADLSHSEIGGADNADFIGGAGSCRCVTDVNWFATVRGRAGVAVGQGLIYATGGVAYAGFFSQFEPGTPGDKLSRRGWTAGAGIEFSFAPNWTAKFEYLRADFGKFHYVELDDDDAVSAKFDMVRAGVNYRFVTGSVR